MNRRNQYHIFSVQLYYIYNNYYQLTPSEIQWTIGNPEPGNSDSPVVLAIMGRAQYFPLKLFLSTLLLLSSLSSSLSSPYTVKYNTFALSGVTVAPSDDLS